MRPARASLPLLERARELALVRRAVDGARQARGEALLFRGPPGVGKSRMLEAAAELGRDEQLVVLTAAAHHGEEEMPFSLGWKLLEAGIRNTPPMPRSRLLAGLEEGVAVLLEDGPSPSPARAKEMGMVYGLYMLCRKLAEQRPHLLVVDDIQLADEESLRFLLFLARHAGGLRLSLVLGWRPSSRDGESQVLAEMAEEPALWSAPLQPFSELAVAEYLRAALSSDVDALFSRACFEATKGSPLLLRELTREIHAQALEPSTAGAARVPELGPAAVAQAVSLRLRRRDPDVLELARALAIAGDGAELRHCLAIANIQLVDMARLADALVEEGVATVSRRVRFEHPVVGRALYLHQPPAQKADAHLRLAEVLHREGGDGTRVGRHLLLAPRFGERWVAEALVAAAEAAIARGSPGLAAGFLRRGLDEPCPSEMRPQVTLALGRAEATAGEPRAVEHLTEAAKLVADPRLRALTALDIGRTLSFQGRHADAAASFERGAAEAAATGDGELQLMIHTTNALARRLAGLAPQELETPAPLPDEAVAGGTPAGHMALAQLALERAFGGGSRDEVIELAYGALSDGEMLESETSDGLCLYSAATALVIAEDLAGAEVALGTAVDDADTRGSVLGHATASYFQAWALARRGHLDASAGASRQALTAEAHGWGLSIPGAHALVAAALLERGDPDGARDELELVAPSSGSGPDSEGPFPLFLATRGLFHLRSGQPGDALADFRECGRRLDHAGMVNPAGIDWRSSAAVACARLGDAAEAEALVGAALSRARSFGAPAPIAGALRALATIRRGSQRIEPLEEAVAILDESQALLERARALVDLGTALRHGRKRQAAREPLRQGLELAHRCGAHALAAHARNEVIAAGARPRRTALSGTEALTKRELQVARLAADGMSNRGIAKELFVTVKTVEWHLSNVFMKLEVQARDQLAALLRQEAEGAEFVPSANGHTLAKRG